LRKLDLTGYKFDNATKTVTSRGGMTFLQIKDDRAITTEIKLDDSQLIPFMEVVAGKPKGLVRRIKDKMLTGLVKEEEDGGFSERINRIK
jgi:hypothetical protein